MSERAQVLLKIREAVAESLALDDEEITLQSKLVGDLGADSLDLIDILFMLEKAFSVKLREDEFDFLARLDVSSQKAMRQGPLGADVVEQLVPWLPALKALPDPAQTTAGQLFGLITVETLCILVEHKLEAKAQGDPSLAPPQ